MSLLMRARAAVVSAREARGAAVAEGNCAAVAEMNGKNRALASIKPAKWCIMMSKVWFAIYCNGRLRTSNGDRTRATRSQNRTARRLMAYMAGAGALTVSSHEGIWL